MPPLIKGNRIKVGKADAHPSSLGRTRNTAHNDTKNPLADGVFWVGEW